MNKTYTIVALKGDGIGPEVTEATIKVLEAVEKKSNSNLTLSTEKQEPTASPNTAQTCPKKQWNSSKNQRMPKRSHDYT